MKDYEEYEDYDEDDRYEEEQDNEPYPAWTEAYLNTLGMSMSDFL